MHMLNPASLNDDEAERVKSAFRPLAERDLRVLTEELASCDRREFDRVVNEAFRTRVSVERIHDDLLELNELRKTATKSFD